MKKERPKKQIRTQEKAWSRPQVTDTNNTPEIKIEKFKNEKNSLPVPTAIETSPWYNFITFCNDYYEEFIPRSEEKQKNQRSLTQIHQKCIEILRKLPADNWEEIITKNFETRQQQEADNFFYYISTRPGQKRSEAESPSEVMRRLKTNLNKFIELAEYAFTESGNRDLVKLNQIAEVIQNYERSERTFLFLSELPTALDNQSRLMFETSNGYQILLRWGASSFLRKFWKTLQEKFRISTDAITDEAAQNLARELGETEANLRSEIEQLKQENEQLKTTLEELRSQALQEAIYNFGKTLQTQPEPVLDQIVLLHQRLEKKSEEGSPLSASDSLSVIITLEAMLKAFKILEIKQFPTNTNQTFALRSEQLGEYSYIEGSVFTNSKDEKIVRCIRPGWRVGQKILTPARVKEVSEEN